MTVLNFGRVFLESPAELLKIHHLEEAKAPTLRDDALKGMAYQNQYFFINSF